MKIECKNIRQGGSRVELGGIEYFFEPQADGAHVAEVTKDEHIDRFLSIADGYKLYRGKASAAPVKTPAKPATEILVGSSVHSASYDIGGKTHSLGDIVAMAHKTSELTVEQWNALPEDERHAKIDAMLDSLDDAGDDRAALVEAYKAKFGKAPHHNSSIETIKAKLAE